MIAKPLTCLLYRSAGDEGVTRRSRGTAARGDVVDDITHGCRAAGAGTRVYTALVAASSVAGTVGVHGALGPTAGVRVAEVVGLAAAGSVVADCVCATRRRVARVKPLWRRLLHCKQG